MDQARCIYLAQSVEAQKKLRLSKEGVVTNVAEGQQQKVNKEGRKKPNIYAIAVQKTKINAKFDKNTTLIRRLSSLYIWKEHGIPEKNN